MPVRKFLIAALLLALTGAALHAAGQRQAGNVCKTTCLTAISEYQPSGNPTVLTYGTDCNDPTQSVCSSSYRIYYSSVSSTVSTKTLVLFVLGQSLSANYTNYAYRPSSSQVQFLDPYNNTVYQLNTATASGPTYTAPILGASGYSSLGNTQCDGSTQPCQGSILGLVGDLLITNGNYSRVIFVNVAIGSSSVNDWTPLGLFNHRLLSAWLQVVANGWNANANVHVGVLYSQGEQDAITNVASGVPSRTQWGTSFRSIVASYVGVGGVGPWFVVEETISNTLCCTSPVAAIADAQLDVVGTASGLNVYSGALGAAGYGSGVTCTAGFDSINATYRWDGTHMGIPPAYPSNNGALLAAACVANAIEAHPP